MKYELVGMGRDREEMTEELKSLELTIQEHIWKIFAYYYSRPRSVNSWVKSLNKHLRILRLKNTGIKKKFNYNKDKLHKVLTQRLFGNPNDMRILNSEFYYEGFPKVELKDSDSINLMKMVDQYIECILDRDKRFSVDLSLVLPKQ